MKLFAINALMAMTLFVITGNFNAEAKDFYLLLLSSLLSFQIISFGAAIPTFWIMDRYNREHLSMAGLLIRSYPLAFTGGTVAIIPTAYMQSLLFGIPVGVAELTLFFRQFVPQVGLFALIYSLVISDRRTFLGRTLRKHLEPETPEFGEPSHQPLQNCLHLSGKSETRIIPHGDILYISAHRNYSVIHTLEEEVRTRTPVGVLEKLLPRRQFIRLHKSYLVNMEFIIRFSNPGRGNSAVVKLSDTEDTTLPVGRKYIPELKNRIATEIPSSHETNSLSSEAAAIPRTSENIQKLME